MDPADLGSRARTVRCARCQHVWRFEPPSAKPAGPEPAAEPASAIAESPPPVAAPDRPPEPDLAAIRANRPGAAARRRTALGWALFVLVVAGLAGGGYVERRRLVEFWPATMRLYAVLGIPVAREEPFLLVLRNLRSASRTDGTVPVLVVSGEVVNPSDRTQKVPPVRIALRDEARREVHVWTVRVEPGELGPHGRTEFTSELASPPEAARDLEISFEGSPQPRP